MRLSAAEEAGAQLVVSEMHSITRNSLENIPLILLGSRSNGLATPLSDFDFTFTTPFLDYNAEDHTSTDTNSKLIRKAVKSLKMIQKDLCTSTKLNNTRLVWARVPILETQHRVTGLKVQIQTMASHQLAQEYKAAYLHELPSLRPLYITLQYFLKIRGLTKVFEGGLGSYSLLMMIVTALKHSSGTFASDDLAGQLLYILHFYGSADLYQWGLSANPPCLFNVKIEWSKIERLEPLKSCQGAQLKGTCDIVRGRDPRKPYLMSLQDPADPSNDLGKNTYAIKHIQATFKRAREGILHAIERIQDFDGVKTSSYLDHLLLADYRAFEAHRSRIEQSTKSPRTRDHDYSATRIEEDFLRRLELHKGTVEKTELGGVDTERRFRQPYMKSQVQKKMSPISI